MCAVSWSFGVITSFGGLNEDALALSRCFRVHVLGRIGCDVPLSCYR